MLSYHELKDKYLNTRQLTVELTNPLKKEDLVVQPAVFASPPKWHLGHTTWFFERIILSNYKSNYKTYNENYNYLFNSYYNTFGSKLSRESRGFLSRPSTKMIIQYRNVVDNEMIELLEDENLSRETAALIELGINHEQQHQELLITDIKYNLGNNPFFSEYGGQRTNTSPKNFKYGQPNFLSVSEGIYEIGHQGEGFCYDNELGRHKVYVHGFEFQDRLVTCKEYMEFIEDGGYERFQLWLSDGWEWRLENDIQCPLYWHKMDGEWYHYTMAGLQKVDLNTPVCHVSFYEADAFSTWKGYRLLTEAEWEAAATLFHNAGAYDQNMMSSKIFKPIPKQNDNLQFIGETWEWTSSAYLPYPFYKPVEGAVGEYNAKFMVNQKVLRGGSCATPDDHIRLSYRNFFYPHERWQFTGFRLARTIE